MIDLSCRRHSDKWVVAMNKWQTLSDLDLNEGEQNDVPILFAAVVNTFSSFVKQIQLKASSHSALNFSSMLRTMKGYNVVLMRSWYKISGSGVPYQSHMPGEGEVSMILRRSSASARAG